MLNHFVKPINKIILSSDLCCKASCKSFHCKTTGYSSFVCSARHSGFGGVDQQEHKLCWRESSVVCLSARVFRACMGVNGRLCMKPLAAQQSDKVTPENKAAFGRYGDQCGHPWPPVFLLYTSPFSPFPIEKGCTASPYKAFTHLSPLLLSGILFIDRWLFAK